jgi:hypothetical protein
MAVYMPQLDDKAVDTFTEDMFSCYDMLYSSPKCNIHLSAKQKLVDAVRYKLAGGKRDFNYVYGTEPDSRYMFKVSFDNIGLASILEYECMGDDSFYSFLDAHTLGNPEPYYNAFRELLNPDGSISDYVSVLDGESEITERALVKHAEEQLIYRYGGDMDELDETIEYDAEEAASVAWRFYKCMKDGDYKRLLSNDNMYSLFGYICREVYDNFIDTDFLFKHFDVLGKAVFEVMEPDYPQGLLVLFSKDIGTYMSIRDSIPISERKSLDNAVEIISHPYGKRGYGFCDICNGNYTVAYLKGYEGTNKPYDSKGSDKWDFYDDSDLHPFYEDALRYIDNNLPSLLEKYRMP